MLALRPYQEDLITVARMHFRAGRKRVLIQLPTGGGKTALSSRMLHTTTDKGKRVWFLCHRRELVSQVRRAFELEGIKYGLVTSSDPMNLRAPAQICSIPTLDKRLDRLPPPDLIVIDECHHSMAKSWSRVINHFPDAYRIGLSATPVRLDGAGLGNHFDAMVTGPSVAWLIENNFLSKYDLYRPANGIDISGLHKRAGEFIQAESIALVDKPKITGDAIAHYRKHCDSARAIAFCVSVEHSRSVAAQFNEQGIPALHIDGKTDDHLRDQMMADFAAGRIRVLCNVDLFGEGYDCPSLEAVILLRPTASLGMYMQQVGRALRVAPGKEHAVILDHVGNSTMHGLPDDDRVWELTAAPPDRKKPAMPPPRVCSRCFGASKAGSIRCRLCLQLFPVDYRQVEQVDGELLPVSPQDLAERERQMAIRRTAQEQGRAQSLEQLVQIGIMRGMRNPEGWAKHVLDAREKKRLMKGAA